MDLFSYPWNIMAGDHGDTKNNYISSHGIDLGLLEYSNFSIRRVKWTKRQPGVDMWDHDLRSEQQNTRCLYYYLYHSSPDSAAYMHQLTGSALIQVKKWRPFCPGRDELSHLRILKFSDGPGFKMLAHMEMHLYAQGSCIPWFPKHVCCVEKSQSISQNSFCIWWYHNGLKSSMAGWHSSWDHVLVRSQ